VRIETCGKAILLAASLSCGLIAQDKPSPAPFRVQVTGKGTPMILIPGLASSGETWDTTVARYSDRYECHLTLAGFAGVPRIPAPMLDKVLDGIADYIRANKLVKPVIVGHSLGGFLALDFAIKYKDLPGKLIMVDAYPFRLGLGDVTPEQAKMIAAQIREGLGGMTQEAYEAYSKAGTSTNPMATSEANQKRLIAWSLASDRTAVGDALAEMFTPDLRPDLVKIKTPVLALGTWRGNEQYVSSAAAAETNFRAQYEKLAGVEIHVSENARHFVMWDDPQWMFGFMDRFLGAK
jgi:pimeloyl-ACP methyl ester carboxylesterase